MANALCGQHLTVAAPAQHNSLARVWGTPQDRALGGMEWVCVEGVCEGGLGAEEPGRGGCSDPPLLPKARPAASSEVLGCWFPGNEVLFQLGGLLPFWKQGLLPSPLRPTDCHGGEVLVLSLVKGGGSKAAPPWPPLLPSRQLTHP